MKVEDIVELFLANQEVLTKANIISRIKKLDPDFLDSKEKEGESKKEKEAREAMQSTFVHMKKPFDQYLHELGYWGIHNNHPTAVHMLEDFYETTGYPMPIFMQRSVQQFHRYSFFRNRQGIVDNEIDHLQHRGRVLDRRAFMTENDPEGWRIAEQDENFELFINAHRLEADTYFQYEKWKLRMSKISVDDVFQLEAPVYEKAKEESMKQFQELQRREGLKERPNPNFLSM